MVRSPTLDSDARPGEAATWYFSSSRKNCSLERVAPLRNNSRRGSCLPSCFGNDEIPPEESAGASSQSSPSGSTSTSAIASGLAIICWTNSFNRCRSWAVLVMNSIPMPTSGSMTRTFPSVLTEQSATRSNNSTSVCVGNGDWVRKKHPPKLRPIREQRMGGSCLSSHCERNHSFRLRCEASSRVAN